MWTVSGVTFKVTSETSIEGEPALGSFVEVQGLVSGGEWIADKVEVSAPKEKNEFTGILEDMDGDTWVVSGAEVKVNSDTDIDADLVDGDSVEVKFMVVGEDWVALSINTFERNAPTKHQRHRDNHCHGNCHSHHNRHPHGNRHADSHHNPHANGHTHPGHRLRRRQPPADRSEAGRPLRRHRGDHGLVLPALWLRRDRPGVWA